MLTREEDVDAHALRRQGWTISAIARHLERDRKTIRAYLNGEAIIPHPPGEEIQFDWLELPDPPGEWGVGVNAHLLVGALAHSGRWRAVLAESEDFPHLVQGLDQVVRKLGGTARRWRFDRMATVCYPSSGQVTAAFAGVAKYYGVGVDVCPSRRSNRKGVVGKANHSAAQRWWRTVPDGLSAEQAQSGVDKLSVRMDVRRRAIDGVRTMVAELAAAEPLLGIPALPFPAQLSVERTVTAQSLVPFDGNFYSVPPGLPGARVTVTCRLGEDVASIATAGRAVIARHRRAVRGAGQTVRDAGHVIALERSVLASFSDRAPCKPKVRRPPSEAALAEAGQLREGQATGSTAERVVIDLSHYAAVAERLRHVPPAERGGKHGVSTAPMQMSEARRYQQLRAHLSYLKLNDAAEALNRVLDQSRTERMTLTAALERLLEIEVEATEARRLAARLRFACLSEPWTLNDFDFAAEPGVDEKPIRDLATLRFLDDASNVLFVGPPGVGKTMLSVALGRAAVDASHRVYFTTAAEPAAKCHKAALEGRWKTCMRFFACPRLLVIDELSYLPLPEDGASALFQVINQLYLKSSTILTTNVGIADWAGAFGDATVAAAMLDRLLHRAAVAGIDGPSYRLRGHQQQAEVLRQGVNARVS